MTDFEYLAGIKDIIEHREGTEKLPDMAPALAMFLENFRPTEPTAPSPHNMTSREIRFALEEMCDMSVTEIAAVMLFLGYKAYIDEYRGMVWSMAPTNQPTNQPTGFLMRIRRSAVTTI